MQTNLFFYYIFFHVHFLLLSYFSCFLESKWSHFNLNPGARRRPSRLNQTDAGIHQSRANLFVSVFVCTGVCFSHCLCLYAFLLMAFSSVSPTLAIFCLVAPNVPLCLSAVTTQLIYIYLQIQEVTAENYTYFKGNYTLVVICCECEFFCVCARVCDLPMPQLHITHAMTFIRYEVKSASRNMTNAFGKITSVVWIQSLWQLTANDAGGNFSRQRWWAILLLAGATNWQIGTKSWLEEINA